MKWDPDQIREDTVKAAWREIRERRKASRDATMPAGFIISRDQKDALEMSPSGWMENLPGQTLWGVPLHVAEEFVDPPSNLVDLRAAVQEG